MASVMCMLLLLIPLPVSANDLGSILLKASVEDETTVYKLSNTEFTMYQVGTYKNNSWALVSEFAKSGVIFDFDASSAQAEAAKNWKNMYRNILKNIFILRFQNMLHICGWSMEKGQFDKKAVERLNRMTWLYERLPEKENKVV